MPQSAAKPPTHPSLSPQSSLTDEAIARLQLANSPPPPPPPPPPPAAAAAAAASDKEHHHPYPDAFPSPSVYGATASTQPRPLRPYGPALEKPHRAGARAAASARARAAATSYTVAASTSFFGIPRSWSTWSTRSSQQQHQQHLAATQGQIDLISLYVVYAITLVSEASRGLLLPSTWPFFRSLGGTKDMLGVFVASLSFGRMVSTIPLGWLSDRYSTATVLATAALVQAAGNLAYALAPNLACLYASRVVVGFGSATMSVCRAHLTRAVPPGARTHHFAYLSALQFIGFAVLPGFGGLLALLPTFRPLPALAFNGFTYPAFLLVAANLACVALVHFLYINPPPSLSPRAASSSNLASPATAAEASPLSAQPGTAVSLAPVGQLAAVGEEEEEEEEEEEDLRPDALALVICIVVNVVFRGVIAEFETVFVPFLMEEYALSYGLSSLFLSAAGFVGLFVYLSFKPIAKRFSDRALVLFGLVVITVGCAPLCVRAAVELMPSWVYVALVGLTWSIAYPVGQTAILSLFSKVLAGLPAGSFLGIFSAAGSTARLSMAIVAGRLWNSFGRDSVYAVVVAYVLLTFALVVAQWKRLVPPSL